MTCAKTGAHIFIEQYGEYAYCNAFELEIGVRPWGVLTGPTVAYFRIVELDMSALRTVVHYTIHNVVDWFDKGDRDIIQTLISDDFTNHGYEGKPL